MVKTTVSKLVDSFINFLGFSFLNCKMVIQDHISILLKVQSEMFIKGVAQGLLDGKCLLCRTHYEGAPYGYILDTDTPVTSLPGE